jgi:glycosyltransferase involved in cell wall biosynthesis
VADADVMVFTPANDMSGGNLRILKVLIHFPQGRYILAMPRDRKRQLLEKLLSLSADKKIIKLVADAYELKNFDNTMLGYIKYGVYVGNVAKELGAELVYFPHEHTYIPLGLKMSKVRWTELLQLTPVIGALAIEDGKGFSLLRQNLKLNGYGLEKQLKAYVRLKLFEYAIQGVPILAVSKSIPYELAKLGVVANVKVLDPPLGIEPCPRSVDDEKEYDVAFHARVIPEKGIFDFLYAVKLLLKHFNNLRAVVIGFATNEIITRIMKVSRELDLTKNIQFIFNAKESEVYEVLPRAKLLLYPSRLDSFPLSVLRSLSCGVPVVAYNIPAIRFNFPTEAVIKVPALNLYELTRKTKEVLSKEWWKELSEEALKFASRFRWEEAAKAEWKSLESLLNS